MDNVTTLLVALFGGAAASLVAGYFARPKTKGEAAQANANATVSLSSDAREWAQLWMKKAEDAGEEARAARAVADDAEDRLTEIDSKLAAAVVYMRTLQNQIVDLGGQPTPPPYALRDMWDEADPG